MAVDVGAVIAESIDNYYRVQTRCDARRSYFDGLRAKLRQLREAAGEFERHTADGDFDDPRQSGDGWGTQEPHPTYRAGYKTGWRAAKEGREPEPPPERAGDPDYMDGYEAGYKKSSHARRLLQHHAAGDWDAADELAAKHFTGPSMAHHMPKSGSEEDQEMWNRWVGATQDPERARQAYHGKALDHTVDAIQRADAALDIDDEHGMEGRDYRQAPQEGKHHVNVAPHPADIGPHLAGRFAAARTAKQRGGAMSGVTGARDVVKTGGDIFGRGDEGGADVGDLGGEGAGSLGGGGIAAPEETGREQIDPEKLEQAHKQLYEELSHLAFGGKSAVDAHHSGVRHNPALQEFLDKNYAPHEYDQMVNHAHDAWLDGIKRHLREAQNTGEETVLRKKVDVPTGGDPHPETGHLAPGAPQVFDPVSALIAALHDPAGFRTGNWTVRAIRTQPGFENFTKARRAPDPANPKKKTTVHPAAGSLDRAMNDVMKWMYDNNAEASHEHPMWDYHFGIAPEYASQVRTPKGDKTTKGEIEKHQSSLKRTEHRPSRWADIGKKLSPRSQETAERLRKERAERAAKEKRQFIRREELEFAVLSVLKLVESWLTENVELNESQLDFVMEEIFSKVQADYGRLFEVAY